MSGNAISSEETLNNEYHQSRTEFCEGVYTICEAVRNGGVVNIGAVQQALATDLQNRMDYLKAGASDENDIDMPDTSDSDGTDAYYEEKARNSLNRDLTFALAQYAAKNDIPVSYEKDTGINSITIDNFADFVTQNDMTSFVDCNPDPPKEREESDGKDNEQPAESESGGKLSEIFHSVTSNPVVQAVGDQLKKLGNWLKDLGNKALDKINDLTKARVAQAEAITPDVKGSNESPSVDVQ